MSGCVLIAGGGTGGHLFPALAVAAQLRALSPGLSLAFVSAGRELETRVLGRVGYKLEVLKARAFRGAGLAGRLASLAVVPGAVLRALGLIRRYRPGLVLAVGGYAALPLGLAARLAGVTLAVQEQNAVPGLTNRVLGRLARVIFVAYPASAKNFPAGRAEFTGNPVRPELIEQAAAAAAQRPPAASEFHVLVIGGSQGARALNQALTGALEHLAGQKGRLRFIHQTGPADQTGVAQAYQQAGVTAEVAAFIEDVGRCYGWAHLVFCRAGAGTLSEGLATGRAMICVPYPYAAGDHQRLNAEALVQAGAARLLPETELGPRSAAAAILELMQAHEQRRDMEARARSLARPQAATDIARRCLELLEEAA
ncbi:MAG: undecaprenyldiphospho-muramoylpentapeptide beta-N-acetylglucosaminyltransferase [Thermodesulfobacteriota bacterium]